MNQAQQTIAAARVDGKQACADYIKQYGWKDAQSYLNQQVPPGQKASLSDAMYGYWDGWCNKLVETM
jgi:hypothetical protein